MTVAHLSGCAEVDEVGNVVGWLFLEKVYLDLNTAQNQVQNGWKVVKYIFEKSDFMLCYIYVPSSPEEDSSLSLILSAYKLWIKM